MKGTVGMGTASVKPSFLGEMLSYREIKMLIERGTEIVEAEFKNSKMFTIFGLGRVLQWQSYCAPAHRSSWVPFSHWDKN